MVRVAAAAVCALFGGVCSALVLTKDEDEKGTHIQEKKKTSK